MLWETQHYETSQTSRGPQKASQIQPYTQGIDPQRLQRPELAPAPGVDFFFSVRVSGNIFWASPATPLPSSFYPQGRYSFVIWLLKNDLQTTLSKWNVVNAMRNRASWNVVNKPRPAESFGNLTVHAGPRFTETETPGAGSSPGRWFLFAYAYLEISSEHLPPPHSPAVFIRKVAFPSLPDYWETPCRQHYQGLSGWYRSFFFLPQTTEDLNAGRDPEQNPSHLSWAVQGATAVLSH